MLKKAMHYVEFFSIAAEKSTLCEEMVLLINNSQRRKETKELYLSSLHTSSNMRKKITITVSPQVNNSKQVATHSMPD
jgi:hypothetical protein